MIENRIRLALIAIFIVVLGYFLITMRLNPSPAAQIANIQKDLINKLDAIDQRSASTEKFQAARTFLLQAKSQVDALDAPNEVKSSFYTSFDYCISLVDGDVFDATDDLFAADVKACRLKFGG